MRRPLPDAYWHALPLHYAPLLLVSGALYAQEELAARAMPVRPRPTAAQRDRKLRLSRFVHLAFAPITPLLIDKRARGYSHALIAFDAALSETDAVAFCAYNAKAWRHRDDFAPIMGAEEKIMFLEAWQRGRYPSAELLVEAVLPLTPHGVALHLASEPEAEWLREMLNALALPCPLPLCLAPERFPPGPAPDLAPHREYLAACRAAGRLLPPPGDIPFD